MSYNPYGNHLEETILGSGPLELVALLYGGLRDAIGRARQAVATGDIAGRAEQVSRAMEIVAELAGSLDTESGGALAAQLAELYRFVNARLVDGHCRQADKPFAEAERVVVTLTEAWQELSRNAAPPAALTAPRTDAYGDYAEEATLSVCG